MKYQERNHFEEYEIDAYSSLLNKGNLKFAFIMGLIGFVIFMFYGHVQHNFELEKCGNLYSEKYEGNFEDINEMREKYSAVCDHRVNHPFALMKSYIFYGVCGFLLFAILASFFHYWILDHGRLKEKIQEIKKQKEKLK